MTVFISSIKDIGKIKAVIAAPPYPFTSYRFAISPFTQGQVMPTPAFN